MSRNYWILIIGVMAAGAGGYYVGYDHGFESSADTSEEARYMDIETFVRQNISELSPVKEQLGGTFFVTKIETRAGAGVVEYEDGHNAYVADVTYTVDEKGRPDVTSFRIR